MGNCKHNAVLERASMTRLRFLLLAAVLTTAFGAAAREHNYVPASKVALHLVLAPPPTAGSQAQKEDLQAVLDIQKKRTAAESQQAKDDAQLTAFRVGDMLGPEFVPEKLPFTAQFLRRALSDSGDSIGAAKAHFNRPRPFLASSDVQPLLERPGGASYPSGHSTFAHLAGILLADMVPERAAEIFARAKRYADNRVVAGVHYPTDVEAGRISAAVIANGFFQDERFMADFNQSKLEVRKLLGLKDEPAPMEKAAMAR